MKKLLATILAFVYLSTSMGATIHLHYCMGKLASWGLINHESKNCAYCGMVKQNPDSQSAMAKKGCCKDEHKQIQTDKDQKLSPPESFKYTLSEAFAINDSYHQGIKVFSSAIEHPSANAPPLIGNLPLFLVFRNFRL